MRIGSLFSGAGGLDMAVENVFGGEVIWQSEVDPAASKVLACRFPCAPNLGDITKANWNAAYRVDIICGGFPCQDVSLAGKRAGIHGGTRSGLWAEMARIIGIHSPRYVVIENVRGLLSATAHRDVESEDPVVGDGSDRPVLRALGAVLGDLSELGYDAQWTTLAASSIGAPHRRERVFILASLADPTGYGLEGHDDRPSLNSSCGSGEGNLSGSLGPAPHCRTCGHEQGLHCDYIGRCTTPCECPGFAEPEPLAMLPTPTSRDHKGHNQRGDDTCLTGALLPTPKASDGEFATPRTSGRPIEKATHLQAIASLEHTSHWGKYATAIHRWEQIAGPAPSPTELNRNGEPRLNPAFSEWMMGWPFGWVTDPDIGISRNDQLKIVGNGVVTQCAEAAIRYLLGVAA